MAARSSVVHIPHAWYVVVFSHELRERPLARRLLGTPLVLFRSRGAAAALLDRCPHRNVPLSLGALHEEGTIECAYHGWRFATDGSCTAIPGLCSGHSPTARGVTAFPIREQQGLIWVWMAPDTPPDHEPFLMPLLDAPGYRSVSRRVTAPGSLHQTLENALDVPHTAFLHRGLFRDGGQRSIEVELRALPDRVEAEYIGEPRPEGLVGRLLSPSGGLVEHVDRFIAPNLLQVEYRIGEENHILVTAAATQVEDHLTDLYAIISYRTRLPGALLEPIAIPLALRIFAQDVAMLKAQTEAIGRFGGEHFQSTELDAIGPGMLALLRRWERGLHRDTPAEPTTRRFTIRV